MKHLPVFTLALLITAGSLQAQEAPQPPPEPPPPPPPVQALAPLAPVQALTPAKAERPLSATGTVEIHLFSGSIKLIGWEETRVEVSGRVGGGVDNLLIDGGEDRVVINVKPDGETYGLPEAALEVRLPSKGRVLVEIINGSIKTEGLAGRVNLESVNGSINVSGVPREAEISAVNGTITLKGDGSMEEGTLETVSGDISVRMDIRPGTSLEISTVSGSIDLQIPKESGVEFEAETFSGNIEYELGPQPEGSGTFMPSQEWSFTLGDGGAYVSLSTFSGSIHIRGL